jgi:hypothetical protein
MMKTLHAGDHDVRTPAVRPSTPRLLWATPRSPRGRRIRSTVAEMAAWVETSAVDCALPDARTQVCSRFIQRRARIR